MLKSLTDRAQGAVPIVPLTKETLAGYAAAQDKRVKGWIKASGFTAARGSLCLVPNAKGGLDRVLAGHDPAEAPYAFAALPPALPAGRYQIEAKLPPVAAAQAALGWALATYAFRRYRKVERPNVELVWPAGTDRTEVTHLVEAIGLARDLINTPAEDMGPGDLAKAVRRIGKEEGAKVSVIEGEDLLERNFPLIHAVGRAAARAPRLIRLDWGKRGKRLALVGKGVCFDSGGLDLKNAQGMLLMKKDMGGAAHALALAWLVMRAKLPIRLTLLIPAVENSVSGNAFRPLDVIPSRKGLTVEIGNTDAEGRLILADSLTLAAEQEPALLLDFATLTGAARVALGTEVPAVFSNHEATAEALLAAARRVNDPLWRLPLHRPYRRLLDSKVADINNVGQGSYAGAITAALFLQSFVPDSVPWAHFDLMAWNISAKPGRPIGGEAMGLRAAYAMVEAFARA